LDEVTPSSPSKLGLRDSFADDDADEDSLPSASFHDTLDAFPLRSDPIDGKPVYYTRCNEKYKVGLLLASMQPGSTVM
jgi:hypothetical protein